MILGALAVLVSGCGLAVSSHHDPMDYKAVDAAAEDGDLETVLIFIEQAFDFEEVVLLEGVDCVLDVIPHFGVELAGAITENERQIRLSGLLRLNLLGYDHESRSDDFVFVVAAIG